MYYKLYNPENVNSIKKCNCGHCAVYPELFHALPYEIGEQFPRNIDKAKHLKKARFPDAIIIEYPNDVTDKPTQYKNLNTGITWKYNGANWKPTKNS